MADRRRIPWWAVVLAFAVLTGGAVAGLAYLRMPAKHPAYCRLRTPNGALVRPLVEHGSRYGRDACELRFRTRAADDAPVVLKIISDRTTHWNTRMMYAAGSANVHAINFHERHAAGAYVQLANELVLVMPGTDGEAIEIRLANDALPGRNAFEIADDIAARLR